MSGDPDEDQYDDGLILIAGVLYDRETGWEAGAENDDRCDHGMFFSGAGACPKCGGGATMEDDD